MNKQKTLYLIDASSIFFRAYYAIPFMKTVKRKTPLSTNALYGYITTTLKILDQFKPKYLMYCFDRPEPSHRLKYYKDYKANRAEMPEDLAEQMPYIHQVTDLLGIPKMDLKGYEADDLIGSLALWSQEHQAKVMIVSSDKDFAQLVNSCTQLFDPMKDIFYDTKAVKEKWGVSPEQIVDYLAIAGDASDNIPGVKGVGPKGAVKLLNQYKDLEGVYENVSCISGRVGEKLKESKKNAFLSKKLAHIVSDLKLVSDWSQVTKSSIKSDQMEDFLSEMEFQSIKRKLSSKPMQANGKEDHAQLSRKTHSTSLSSKEKNKASLIQLKNSRSSLDMDQKIAQKDKYKNNKKSTMLIMNTKELIETIAPYSEVGVFLFEQSAFLFWKNKIITLKNINFKKLGEVLCYKKIKWWGYDIKEIWHQCQVSQPIASFDIMLAVHLLTEKTTQSFKFLCEEEGLEELSEKNAISHLVVLRKKLTEELLSCGLKDVYESLELPLVPVLYEMEKNGILLDPKKLNQEKNDLNCDLIKIEEEVFCHAGHPFNISSPQQLSTVLFDELKLKKGRKTKTGYSTDGDVLYQLKKDHPIISCILEYRELFKLKTTYVEGLLNALDQNTSRVHTSFKQTMTATGRLSSVKPNLQNIPIKTKRGKRIRSFFVSSEKNQLICADYSQIELRILAHFCQDEGLMQSFLRNEDIHQTTASEIFNVPLKQVTVEQRRQAKAVNFGITYGQTAFGLSDTLKISHYEAQEIVDRYFKKFSKVKDYITNSLKEATQKGYVETLSGRRRRVLELQSKNKNIQKLGERVAINTPIQGTASDIVKQAMIQLNKGSRAKMLLQIHDELIFECKEDYAHQEAQWICEKMEKVVKLSVPLVVNVRIGQHW